MKKFALALALVAVAALPSCCCKKGTKAKSTATRHDVRKRGKSWTKKAKDTANDKKGWLFNRSK
jgi:hypothetical protein